MSFLCLRNVSKTFKTGNGDFYALKDVSLSFDETGFVAVTGKSGSGKSTLLNILLQIEKPSSGSVFYKNHDISKYREKQLSEYRNKEISVIFQHYNLFGDLSVADNTMIPALIGGADKKEAERKSKEYLLKFGMSSLKERKADTLSGGEKQRTAIIRALMNDPNVLLCDEPTGALDEKNSRMIMDILKDIARTKLVIIVSHNQKLVDEYCSRIITLKDGRVESDVLKSESPHEKKDAEIRKRGRRNWTKIFTNRHFKKNLVKNILTFASTVFGLLAVLAALGFSGNIEKTSEKAIENNLAITTAEVSKKEYISIENSPLQYEKSTRPDNEELNFLYSRIPSLTIEPNLSYFIPYVPTLRFNKEVLNSITFLPIYGAEGIEEFTDVIINDKTLELLKVGKDDALDEIITYTSKSSPSIQTGSSEVPIVRDNIEINLKLTIKDVAEEFSFLNTPKVYYSYPLFLEYVSSIKLESISDYKGETVTALDYVLTSSDDSEASAYSQYAFVQNIDDISLLFSLKDELDDEENPIRIESDVYSIKETYVTFMTSFSSSLEIFIFISFAGVCFIIGITSLSSFISNKKESAVLTILGARNSEIISIFTNESLSVVLLSLTAAFALSFPLQKLINFLVNKYAQIPDIISIPFRSFLGYPYLLPIGLSIVTIAVSLVFILTPLLIYKKISLSDELKDE